METENLWQRLSRLPERDQQKVEAFIEALERKQRGKRPPGALSDEPFIGLWKDRDDLADSTTWVRDLRAGEWQR